MKAVIAVRMEDSALPCSVLAVALMPTMVRHASGSRTHVWRGRYAQAGTPAPDFHANTTSSALVGMGEFYPRFYRS